MIRKTDFVFANRVNCPCKYNFSDDGKKVTPRRDVPNYPKVCCCMMPLEGIPWSSRVSADCPPPHPPPVQYTLSQETVEALKKPTFDVWHWEHNEVR